MKRPAQKDVAHKGIPVFTTQNPNISFNGGLLLVIQARLKSHTLNR